jgi:hypothetical protein
MNTIFPGESSHYAIDRPLLRRLGLDTAPLPHAQRCVLGEVRVDSLVTVVVGCSAFPAKFWTFNFHLGGELVETWETDSGSLSTYWPEAERRARTLSEGGAR